MMPTITEIPFVGFLGIGIGQFFLAVFTVILIYQAREHSVTAGVLVGASLPVIIVGAQYHYGQALFAITVGEMIQLTLISVGAGVIGLALAAVILEPEIDEPMIPRRTTQKANNG